MDDVQNNSHALCNTSLSSSPSSLSSSSRLLSALSVFVLCETGQSVKQYQEGWKMCL